LRPASSARSSMTSRSCSRTDACGRGRRHIHALATFIQNLDNGNSCYIIFCYLPHVTFRFAVRVPAPSRRAGCTAPPPQGRARRDRRKIVHPSWTGCRALNVRVKYKIGESRWPGCSASALAHIASIKRLCARCCSPTLPGNRSAMAAISSGEILKSMTTKGFTSVPSAAINSSTFMASRLCEGLIAT
jgi:hypothetical protein